MLRKYGRRLRLSLSARSVGAAAGSLREEEEEEGEGEEREEAAVNRRSTELAPLKLIIIINLADARGITYTVALTQLLEHTTHLVSPQPPALPLTPSACSSHC